MNGARGSAEKNRPFTCVFLFA